MKQGDFIFVYGTLRKGERADLAKQACHFNVRPCGKDRINGKLYHLGAYPGVKQIPGTDFDPEKPCVVGDLFLVNDPSVGAFLDAYEGYFPDEPDQGLYNRRIFHTEKGKLAWVYTYNAAVTSDQQLHSGDWCKNQDMPVRQRVLRSA